MKGRRTIQSRRAARSDCGWGQADALQDFAVAGTTWLVEATGTRGRHGNHLSRIGVRDMLSYQFGGLCYNFRPPRRD